MADECELKFIVLGECGVGKTSLLLRFAKKNDHIKPTIIIDRLEADLVIQGIKIHLQLWDTGGQERFRCITKNYFRDIDGVLLVYDVTNMSSFLKLSSWLLDLKSENDTAICFIVGNKIDDPNRNAVCVNQVKSFAEEENLEFHESSATTGENVNKIFERLTLKVMEFKQIITMSQPPPSSAEELESSEDSILSTYSVIPARTASHQNGNDVPDNIHLQRPIGSVKKKKKDCLI